MSLPPIQEKRPLPLHQPQKAQAKTTTFTSSTHRFSGKQDVFFGSNALPDWTKGVNDPKATDLDLQKLKEKQQEAFMQKGEDKVDQKNKGQNTKAQNKAFKTRSPFTVLKALYQTGRMKNKIAHELERTSEKYLPEVNKKALSRYKFNPRSWYFKLYPFAGPDLKRLRMQGPDAVKEAQDKAQRESSVDKPASEEMVQRIETILKNKKEFDKQYKELNWPQKQLMKAVLRIFAFYEKRQINRINRDTKVLNQVPPLPKKEFQKQLDELKDIYNKKHTNDPIVEIGDAIKAGSVGQVFGGKTKSGKKLVLKVVKPEITPQYLDDYRKFLYFRYLVKNGTEQATKKQAALQIANIVELLKEEANPEQENKNTQAMKKAVSSMGITSFDVPEISASSKHGFIMPYVGDKDFQEISDSETRTKHVNNITPDLLRFLTFSNAKPLDIHAGNVRIGEKPFLIDHGRQANLNADVHKALLNLLTVAYAHGNSDTHYLAKSKEVRQALKALYQLKPNAESDYLKSLNNLDQLEQTSGVAEKQALEKELQPDIEKVSNLICELLDNPEERGWDKHYGKKSQQTNLRPFLLTTWTNYTSKSNELGLPALTDKPIAAQDLERYQKRTRDFMQSYFPSPYKNSQKVGLQQDKELVAALRNEQPDNLVYNNEIGSYSYSSDPQKAAEQKEAQTKKLEETRAQIKKHVNDVLNGNNKHSKENLLRHYKVRRHIRPAAKEIAGELNKLSHNNLSNSQLRILEENLRSAIKSDFDTYDHIESYFPSDINTLYHPPKAEK